MPNLIRIFNETYPPSAELKGYIQKYRNRGNTGEGNPNTGGGGGGPFS